MRDIEFKEQVRAAVDLREYAASRGVEKLGGRSNRFKPPWRPESDSGAFAIDAAGWYDHAKSEGGDCFTFVEKMDSVSFKDALSTLAKYAGLSNGNGTRQDTAKASGEPWREVATYDYQDGGELLFQVVRKERGTGTTREKTFRQRTPDGEGGWRYTVKGTRKIPFRLDHVRISGRVMIVEGEKDALRLESCGLVATCNAGGAGQWQAEFSQHFTGKRVVILADNDTPGKQHAQDVARMLHGTAASVKLVTPSDMPKGDVSDYLDDGGTLAQLEALISEAQEWTPPAKADPAPVPQDTGAVHPGTDTANTKRLNRIFNGAVRFVHEMQGHYRFSGARWQPDAESFALAESEKIAKVVMAEAQAIEGNTKEKAAMRDMLFKFARQSEDSKRRRDALGLWRGEPGATVSINAFDAEPWLLNCRNGTIDLKTGTLREHRRDDMLTHCLDVDYDEGATCERWADFLFQIFNDDAELVSFIQRAIGYALTGDTSEQCAFVFYGAGANGKSTLLRTIAQMLNGLAKHAAIETFSERNTGRIPEDRARLRNARFVTASEANRGAKLDEAFLKDSTGGEPIAARFLHQNTFEYIPVFKLFLACNHKPRIAGTDEGVWRRIRLVPFCRVFAPEERDHALQDVLLGELPGILNWAVQGCLAWQETGLNPPESVLAATSEYRSESDVIGSFLDERAVVDSGFSAAAGELFAEYREWAETGGYRAMNQRNFGIALKEKGFENQRGAGGRIIWRGLRLAEGE